MNANTKEINKSEQVCTSTEQLRVILDDKYEKADLNKLTKTRCQHLTVTQNIELLQLLQKIEDFFDTTLSIWKIYPVDSQLKEGENLTCSIPYPVPKVHKEMSKKKVEHLVLLGFLERQHESEWRAQPKPKTNQVHFLSDFIN